ncbi:flagellar export chaperone FliS [Desulfohalobium retbaense]|uniref:Flagellar secretion chaperone FliS n=1 Tax=Desulfohalobium retbaense (strain ATCC 49708 / DSM 5692 / JCM 16813 / HR100) TaxID=485915 RepID=C8WZ12_DESRD|nr:flagellar export chaperone FliS [Desulfohalobium retbaense]ACV67928.1 flagellar protein FliS [Desulfohalobium retbaense DSM 5692]
MQPVNPYQQNQVHTAPREDILLQLFEGAIIRLKQAQDYKIKNQIGKAREQRIKAFDIISYLDATLDANADQELVDSLHSLYDFMLREITQASLNDDFERLDNVVDVLSTLFEGWKDAVAEYKKSQHQHKPLGGPSYGQAENYGDMRSYEGSR